MNHLLVFAFMPTVLTMLFKPDHSSSNYRTREKLQELDKRHYIINKQREFNDIHLAKEINDNKKRQSNNYLNNREHAPGSMQIGARPNSRHRGNNHMQRNTGVENRRKEAENNYYRKVGLNSDKTKLFKNSDHEYERDTKLRNMKSNFVVDSLSKESTTNKDYYIKHQEQSLNRQLLQSMKFGLQNIITAKLKFRKDKTSGNHLARSAQATKILNYDLNRSKTSNANNSRIFTKNSLSRQGDRKDSPPEQSDLKDRPLKRDISKERDENGNGSSLNNYYHSLKQNNVAIRNSDLKRVLDFINDKVINQADTLDLIKRDHHMWTTDYYEHSEDHNMDNDHKEKARFKTKIQNDDQNSFLSKRSKLETSFLKRLKGKHSDGRNNHMSSLKVNYLNLLSHRSSKVNTDSQSLKNKKPNVVKVSSKQSNKRSNGMDMAMSMNSMKDDGNMDMDMDKTKRLMAGYKYHVMLDMKSKLMLCWNVNYENNTVSFRITCQLPPNYWFGVGFSDYGEATGADFVVFWNDPVQTHHLQDSWTDSQGILHSDKSQDYFLHKARTEDGLSILEFTRQFDTCDNQDYLLDNGTTHIVYFTGKGTPASCIGKDVRQLRTGFQRVQLLKPDVHLPPLPKDVWTFEIRAPRIHVPGTETTYWWYITTLPKLQQKHHIVRYEGVIDKKNEGIVHHIEVFHCTGNTRPYSGPKVPEGKMDPGSDLARCKNVIGAWAMGAEPIIYPEVAGSPIGGDGFSPYVLLEVHFHNPHLQSGHIDSSGIRFYVTPTLRRYDMGIMELGLEYSDKMSIPPKQDMFTLSGYCIADCTRQALPPQGINIFASQLHTHLTGKKVWTKHIRNGKELPEVNRDNHYSPHFQEVRVLPQPANILPGDALITECVDSTKTRSNVTYGGFSITEEMCVNYIHYYPKVNLEVCKSSISEESLNGFFYFMKRMEGVPIEFSKGIKYNYNVIPWLPINVRLLDYLYQTSPISMQCNQSNGQRFPGNWEGVPLTKIDRPLDEPEKACTQS